MPWFDGTFTTEEEKLKKQFPLFVNDDLRLSEDRKKLAVVNHFQEGDPLCELSDPKVEYGQGLTYVFYHVFVGEEAKKSEEAVSSFLAARDQDDGYAIYLYRVEDGRLFLFAYGYLATRLLRQQERLKEELNSSLPEGKEVFILPLRRYMFECPVCHNRTLPYRGMCDICDECGWEDFGEEDDDECSPLNGCTVGSYRKAYLEVKKKRPEYKRWADGRGVSVWRALLDIREEELNALWEKALPRIASDGFPSGFEGKANGGEDEANPIPEAYRKTFAFLNSHINPDGSQLREISETIPGYLKRVLTAVSSAKPSSKEDRESFPFGSYEEKDAPWIALSIAFLSHIRQSKEFRRDVDGEEFLSFCAEADPSGASLPSDGLVCYLDYEVNDRRGHSIYRFVLKKEELGDVFEPICYRKGDGDVWRLCERW